MTPRGPSVTALRGPAPGAPPGGGHGAGAPPPAAPAGAEPPIDERLLHPLPARVIAFFALAAFGALHWMRMLEPAAGNRAGYALGSAAAVIAILLIARRLPRLARMLAVAAACVSGAALALLGAGVADELLRPDRWGALVAGIARGIEALPGARVPYRGLDEWMRVIIPLGGTVLAVLAALLAFWPRGARTGFPGLALVALVTLYAVPAVALIFDAEFVRGAALALLVVAFLRLERLRRRDTGAAAAAGAVAAALALAIAPAIDGLDPWWDYETWALSAAGSRSTTFAWDHDYGPLQWPRDGRELLRIRATRRAYWKADQLDVFDGRRWVRGDIDGGRLSIGALFNGVEPRRLERSRAQLNVTVRNLRSETFVAAGTVEDIVMPGRPERQTSRPGIFRTTRTLRRGDAYRAIVYLPTPTPTEMRRAGTDDSGAALGAYRRVEAGAAAGGFEPDTTTVLFDHFGAEPVTVPPRGAGLGGATAEPEPAGEILDGSDLYRVWALAKRLRAGARTPYDYVRRVERFLERGFSYSERPPARAGTMDGFLFESRVGYCQQFSGAMALLLRMGGVPARVATGFSPGSYNEKSKEYVVRDIDAHSWVEAWFPGIGWVTFDPTPSSAPPRLQAADQLAPSTTLGDVRDIGIIGEPATGAGDGGPPWGWIGGGSVVLAALAFFTARGVRRRRLAWSPLGELERALRITGDGVAPQTTLAALETRFSGSAPAAGYLRALRAQRYASHAGGPTPAQRRGLRRALSSGRGLAGRLRGWWALPPKLPSVARRR